MRARASVRFGRGVWLTGGGGLLVVVLAMRVLEFGTLIAIRLAGVAVVSFVETVALLLSRTPGARRTLCLRAVQGSVNPALVRLRGEACDPAVWGVYMLGRETFVGAHPRYQGELRRLYADRADQIVCVALMPDRQRARGAARQLLRGGFTSQELTQLFGRATAAARADERRQDTQPSVSRRVQPVQDISAPTQPTPKEHRTMSSERDLTKYQFDGQVLGKGRLVLALVKRYVADHPQATFAALNRAFPDSLQAQSPVQFSSVQVVVARVRDLPPSEHKRFFLGDGETIRLFDAEVAVSREWNKVNIENVLSQAAKLGYTVGVA